MRGAGVECGRASGYFAEFPMHTTPQDFDHLPPEDQAARLLFHREHGFTSVGGLAAAMELPIRHVELLMCRGLATAAKAPVFGPEFTPIGEWRWQRVDSPERPAGWLADDQAAYG
jgi:hypothetical protein